MKNRICKIILLIAAIFLLIAAVFSLKAILMPVFISFLVAYIFYPFVKYMEKKKIGKKTAAVICIMTTVISVLCIIIFIIPATAKDMLKMAKNIENSDDGFLYLVRKSSLYNKMPDYIKVMVESNSSRINSGLKYYLKLMTDQITSSVSKLPAYILSPIFIYYFIVDSEYFINFIKRIIPLKYRNEMIKLGRKVDNVIGSYIRGQIMLSLLIFALTVIFLVILNVKYALIIGIINGIVNIIPYFGPILGMLPAFFSACSQSVEKAFLVVIILFAIQEFESNFVAPKILGNSIGIHPVFIIIILLIGGKYFGAWGLVFSVPFVGILKVIFEDGTNKLF